LYEALFPSVFDRGFSYERLLTENHCIPRGDFQKLSEFLKGIISAEEAKPAEEENTKE
tara:strand:+ start:122 stop:295 length:174 start_codon:yes stop_codon:yes gene_type:complete